MNTPTAGNSRTLVEEQPASDMEAWLIKPGICIAPSHVVQGRPVATARRTSLTSSRPAALRSRHTTPPTCSIAVRSSPPRSRQVSTAFPSSIGAEG